MKVFVSYRRDDTEHATARIYERLEAAFGRGTVFMDVDCVPPGTDFREAIETALIGCDLVLVPIGNQWLTIADETGRPRLFNADDPVRTELEVALRHNIPIVPLLIGRATMPKDVELPPTLQSLAYRNAALLRSGADFNQDTDHLIQALVDNFAEIPTLETPCDLVVDEIAVPKAAIDGIRLCLSAFLGRSATENRHLSSFGGLLICGAPKTGKTLLLRAACHESSLPLQIVSCRRVAANIQMGAGSVLSALSRQLTRAQAHLVVALDEFEVLCDGDHLIQNYALSMIDDWSRNSKVLVAAVFNRISGVGGPFARRFHYVINCREVNSRG